MIFLAILGYFLFVFIIIKIQDYYTKYAKAKSKIESYFKDCEDVSFLHHEMKNPFYYIGFYHSKVDKNVFISINLQGTSLFKRFTLTIYNYMPYSGESLDVENFSHINILEGLKIPKSYSFNLFPSKKNIEESLLDFHQTFKEITFDTDEKVAEYDKILNSMYYEAFNTNKWDVKK